MTELLQSNPVAIIDGLWEAMRGGDIASVNDILDREISWENVGLPTVYGRDSVMRFIRLMNGRRRGFDVKVHRVAANGNIVMTERTDVIIVGPLHIRFWICGVFEVSDRGTITLWRDYGDYLDIALGLARAVVGVFFPTLRPKL